MSLVSMPFVGTGADVALHALSATVLVATVGALLFGFWKLHELPVHHAKKKEHRQIALISMLTWIGFVWHWVWVLAVIIAFVDGPAMLRNVRDIWNESGKPEEDNA